MILNLRKISAMILLVGILNGLLMPAWATEAGPEVNATAETQTEQHLDEIPGTAPSEEETTPATPEAEPSVEESVPMEDASVEDSLPTQDVPAEESAPAEDATTEETVPAEETPETVLPPEETEIPGEVPEETGMTQEETVPFRLDREMPHYFQTDYPDERYGSGTIETEGCGITCVAMVGTYMTGQEYLPDTLAAWFGSYGYNNVERVEYASDMLQLPYRKARDIDEIFRELQAGNVAIVLMDSLSAFTDTQHFIVLKEITEDGKILVMDPYEPNYGSWELSTGLAEGFTKEFLTVGYSGGWIYDVRNMPEEPFIYSQPITHRTYVEHWKQMPLYDQNDYPNDRFGAGTIATSGCAITSLAMVATYMTGHTYLPDALADWFGGHGANNVERLEYASDMLQLPYRKAWNVHEVLSEVRNGNIAIMLMNSKSIFTASQHFIVLAGVTKNGRYMVLDSYAPNYDKETLKNGFETGFTEEELVKGYDGGWIYVYDAMPEDPFIYVEEKPYVEPRYPGIALSWEEQQLLAKVIWVEARGESAEGQQAIAEIVFNRMVSPDFPDTLAGVIYAENQFRSVKFLEDAEPWQAQYDAIEDALEGPYVLPINVFHFARYPVNENVWGKIGGHVFCYQWDEADYHS